ncbi:MULTISPECIES: N-acetylmannosamine-6-phosphate 2-epimerase [unclassified Devosia]|uniref:N-acetylmannosamine-6-phosphate 2-epimerase n=1 Tax=unclassified Devosia TaxID=196773 RepID=UPI00145F8979|nr:N-acetylmannosamine-6-phosphate 2-epimerase [Devosia sp. MC521]MBJ6988118.1 N-acetylmannosamine-6-phosphate 2-epimerase [Devosia sp. MC521]QMW63404.1 N-acetylmannosamine-6-phosphate 2-epimerase [Devosia sp. MC521]
MHLPKGLVVSCQARADNPLHGAVFMGAMALAARDGGAVAVRANGPADIAAVKAAGLPVIGIHKVFADDRPVYITPNFEAAAAIVEAGAEVVALDCTERPRHGEHPSVLIRRIRDELGAEVFADISTLDEGLKAADWGATYLATTLSGYTEYTQPKPTEPDYRLLETLAAQQTLPVIAEGRYNTPDLVQRAFSAGAHAVVVGTMITNPREITRAFVSQGVPT